MVVPACSFTPGRLPSDALVEGLPDDADVTAGWSTPTLITELATPESNDDPSLTNDLLEIYFGSTRAGGLGMEDIYVAKRTSVTDPFGPATLVTELSSSAADTTMRVTGGGLSIYFASDRGGNVDIYMSTRPDTDSVWATPTRVMELSTGDGDWAPFAQSDQLRVVLCSGPTPNEEALFIAKRASTGDAWGPLAKVTELDETTFSECDPVEPRSNVLYYSSNYQGKYDIYRASRASSTSPYGNRTGIPSIDMPSTNDRDAWLSPDERTMVFASDRDLVNYQLYISTR